MKSKPLFVYLSILGAGCGGGGSNPDTGVSEAAASAVEAAGATEAAGTEDGGGAPSPYCTSKSALASVTDLSGTWVMRVVGSQHVTAIGTNLYPKSVFYIVTTISQSGTGITADGHYCDRTEIDAPGTLVPVIIPDKWAHTEKPIHRTGSFVPGSDGVSVLSFPDKTEVAGAVLASDTDPLPTDPLDPRVIDEDNDGYPGITVKLGGIAPGSLYSVQKQITSVVAVPVAPDRLEGALTFTSSQVVLDSNPTTLATLYAQSTTLPDLTACASTFAMVRVGGLPAVDGGAIDASAMDAGDIDGGGTGNSAVSCAWVRANEAVLFP